MTKTKILIVEDESLIAQDIEQSLKKLDYEVIGIASKGKEAIQLCDDHKPDLVLMDIMLKGSMDGIQTAEKISQHHDIPIIYLTAYADESTLDRAKITEPYGYIIKPFKEIDLHTSIEISLYKHEKEMEVKRERDLLYSLVDNKKSKEFIFIKSRSRLIKIKTEDIYYIEALKDYIVINTPGGRFTIHSTMKSIANKMAEKDFIRVHRSYFVRLDKIEAIDHHDIILDNEKMPQHRKSKQIPIGGSYKEELMARLNLL